MCKIKLTSSVTQLAFNKKIEIEIILRQLKFKKSQSTHTFHYERKKVFKLMFVVESNRKDKSNHEVLGLWQRSLRLYDVIDF